MRRLTRILCPLVAVAMAAAPCRAGEEDAAKLATLIDQQIDARLRTEGVKAAVLADDAEFVRRIYLDLTGRIPTAPQVTASRPS